MRQREGCSQFKASTAPGCEVALDSRSRASWAILIEEGWYLQQRERLDDETPREGLDDFGETAKNHRTQGRSLGGG